jgi:hypothetical protein
MGYAATYTGLRTIVTGEGTEPSDGRCPILSHCIPVLTAWVPGGLDLPWRTSLLSGRANPMSE